MQDLICKKILDWHLGELSAFRTVVYQAILITVGILFPERIYHPALLAPNAAVSNLTASIGGLSVKPLVHTSSRESEDGRPRISPLW